MKTNSTIKLWMLALVMTLSVAACKKKESPEPTPPPVEVKAMTITELKALSTGSSVKLPDARTIKGIVISDASAKNIDAKTVILQEATDKPGVIVTFDAAQTFALGDEIEVVISNQTLAQVNGEIVLQNVPAANAKKTATGTITPRATTIADITTNKVAWNGTLVTIAATELSGGNGKFSGSLMVKDASGTAASTVLAGATFENAAYPASVSSLIGIVRVNGNNINIDIRKATDITVGAVTRIVVENFDGLVAADGKTTLNIGSWKPSINGWRAPALVSDVAGDVNVLTEPGKVYPYIYGGYGYNVGLGLNAENLQGLKTITVTFAYSKTTSITIGNSKFEGADLYTFNPAKDKVQIGIAPKYIDPANNNRLYSITGTTTENFLTLSPQYSEAGKEYTYTYTMPTESELTLAKGVNASDLAKFLAKPSFAIYNKSVVNDGNTATAPLFAIVVKKVVLGFSN